MNKEIKIFNPYTSIETTLTVDDEHDEFHVIEEKIINNKPLSELKVGNRYQVEFNKEKSSVKIKKKVVKKRPAKTFGKNKIK